MGKKNEGSVLMAIIWMFVIQILLFWLPVAGPVIAGVVGGKRAGNVGNALLAVFLPALIFGAILFFMSSFFTGIPLIGVIAGSGGFALVVADIGPLLIGAIVGGIIA